jgi:hypothetical protein
MGIAGCSPRIKVDFPVTRQHGTSLPCCVRYVLWVTGQSSPRWHRLMSHDTAPTPVRARPWNVFPDAAFWAQARTRPYRSPVSCRATVARISGALESCLIVPATLKDPSVSLATGAPVMPDFPGPALWASGGQLEGGDDGFQQVAEALSSTLAQGLQTERSQQLNDMLSMSVSEARSPGLAALYLIPRALGGGSLGQIRLGPGRPEALLARRHR